jgi:hypothetical protein
LRQITDVSQDVSGFTRKTVYRFGRREARKHLDFRFPRIVTTGCCQECDGYFSKSFQNLATALPPQNPGDDRRHSLLHRLAVDGLERFRHRWLITPQLVDSIHRNRHSKTNLIDFVALWCDITSR